ncbi:hypothetical protein D9M71_575050 [compost metagenome]
MLLQLATQQLGLLLGLGPAFFRITQFAVGLIHVQARLTHFFVDAHALFQQLFKFKAQLFKRCLALFQIERELLALFAQALRLQFQALKGLAGRVVLRPQRSQPHGQLMTMILVLTGLLTHPIEALPQAVALGQEQLTLLGVQGHQVEGLLQLQA